MIDLIGISEGDLFTLFLLSDGTVQTSGRTYRPELGGGLNYSNFIESPQKVTGLSNIIKISSGFSHSLALDNNGLVYSWGNNHFGTVSPGLPEYVGVPYRLPPLENILSVSAALHYSLALDASGSVWCWGSLNQNIPIPPTKFSSLSDIVWIGATDIFALALDDMGNLFWWQSPGNSAWDNPLPYEPTLFTFDKKILSVSAGFEHALFQADDMHLYGFGKTADYKLGLDAGKELLDIPLRMFPLLPPGIKSFVAGKTFSAFEDSKDRIILFGSATNLNSNTPFAYYDDATYITLENTKVKSILFSKNSTTPPSPKTIESALREFIIREITL